MQILTWNQGSAAVLLHSSPTLTTRGLPCPASGLRHLGASQGRRGTFDGEVAGVEVARDLADHHVVKAQGHARPVLREQAQEVVVQHKVVPAHASHEIGGPRHLARCTQCVIAQSPCSLSWRTGTEPAVQETRKGILCAWINHVTLEVARLHRAYRYIENLCCPAIAQHKRDDKHPGRQTTRASMAERALKHPRGAMLGLRDGLPHIAVRQRQPELAVGGRARRQALRVLVRRARLVRQAPGSGSGGCVCRLMAAECACANVAVSLDCKYVGTPKVKKELAKGLPTSKEQVHRDTRLPENVH